MFEHYFDWGESREMEWGGRVGGHVLYNNDNNNFYYSDMCIQSTQPTPWLISHSKTKTYT